MAGLASTSHRWCPPTSAVVSRRETRQPRAGVCWVVPSVGGRGEGAPPVLPATRRYPVALAGAAQPGGLHEGAGLDRRQLLSLGLGAAADGLLPAPAQASLVMFPAAELYNRYFLVRAGQGVREGQGLVYTNPAFKTSMDSGLDDMGKRQVVKITAPTLEAMGAGDTPWLWASMNQRSYQTAEVLAYMFQVGQSRIVPEYSFLDARGMGALEGHSLTEAEEVVAAGDALDPSWKMTPGVDGTPNESVNDIMVRVRQMMSVIETQFSGEDIIVIAPDSQNLSILQAAVIGTDLRQHSQYAFAPGEARMLELSPTGPDTTNFSFTCRNPPTCA